MSTAPPGFLSHFHRLETALTLRREGKSYQQIADICGLRNEHAAQNLISKAIKRVLRETAEEVRSIELSRLELLIKTLWDKGIKDVEGDRPDFRRLDRIKQLIEAKLKWCGASPVMELGGNDNRVQIYINKFTGSGPVEVPSTALTLDQRAGNEEIEAELALLSPDDEKPEDYR